MLTKAIIENVITTKVNTNTIYKYAVRIPLLHGYSSDDGTPTAQLPTAIYCTPPHGEKTQLRIGDIVYVGVEDYNLDNIVIFGLIPYSDVSGWRGASQTKSGCVFENINTLTFSDSGSIELPANTKMIIPQSTTDIKTKSYITAAELSYLKNVREPIQGQLDNLQNLIPVNIVESFASTYTINELQPNTEYRLGTITALTVSAVPSGYYKSTIKFMAGANTTVTFTPTIYWNGGTAPSSYTEGHFFEISISDGHAVYGEFY